MFDKQTSLLIGFFQQAIQVGEVEPDPAKYLDKFRSEIEDTGRLFAYLGLAKADKRSPLGWKPTAPLLDLIAKSKARRSKPTGKSASLVDTLILDLMLETVLGSDAGNFCCYVLIELGLILRNLENDWLPAPQLVQLFSDAYYIRQLTQAHDPDAVYEVVHTSYCLLVREPACTNVAPAGTPGGVLFWGDHPHRAMKPRRKLGPADASYRCSLRSACRKSVGGG